jgi:hypothetical protein
MSSIAPFARTLDQELLALTRGASFECAVCGEFVLRFTHAIACPECRTVLADGVEVPEVPLPAVQRASYGARCLGPSELARAP